LSGKTASASYVASTSISILTFQCDTTEEFGLGLSMYHNEKKEDLMANMTKSKRKISECIIHFYYMKQSNITNDPIARVFRTHGPDLGVTE